MNLKLRINRKKWLEKSIDGPYHKLGSTGMLLNRQGEKCCLGFLAKKCGLKDNDIYFVTVPRILVKDYVILDKIKNTPFAKLLTRRNTHTKICEELIATNDSYAYRDKEARLTTLFKKIGVDVTFVG